MQIEFDTEKREKTLAERGLDFARAGEVFLSPCMTIADATPKLRRTPVEHGGLSGSPHGGIGVDSARRGPSHYQHKESK